MFLPFCVPYRSSVCSLYCKPLIKKNAKTYNKKMWSLISSRKWRAPCLMTTRPVDRIAKFHCYVLAIFFSVVTFMVCITSEKKMCVETYNLLIYKWWYLCYEATTYIKMFTVFITTKTDEFFRLHNFYNC